MTSLPTGHRAARDLLRQMQRTVADARDHVVATDPRPTHTAETVPIALVPRHNARIRQTADRRHAMLAQHLRGLLGTMRQTGPEQDDGYIEQPAPLGTAATRVVIAVCSACKGACCAAGREHAFLRVRTMREFAVAHPSLTDDEIVQAYLAPLPERTSHPGCVYQGARGCTLPRDMRSAICNSYLCNGLQQAVNAATPETVGVYVAHRDGVNISGGRLRALPVLGQN